MGRKKQDDISRKVYSVKLANELIKKIKVAAAMDGKLDYQIAEEALVEYFHRKEQEGLIHGSSDAKDE